MNTRRDFSRVLEMDPVSLEVLWQFPSDADRAAGVMLYSPFVSGVQRLENGNTFVCQGIGGRMLEVTAENEIVWEYISPYCSQGKHTSIFGQMNNNMVYRAYRVPYDWAPIKEKPVQTPVRRIDNNTFRIPGAADAGGAEAVDFAEG